MTRLSRISVGIITAVLPVMLLFASCEKEPKEQGDPGNKTEEENPKTDKPVLKPGSTDVLAKAGTYVIPVTIENPADGASLSAIFDGEAPDWITLGSPTEQGLQVTVKDNLSEDRSAKVKLSYTGADDLTVTVTQKKWDYSEFGIEMSNLGPFTVTFTITRKTGYHGGYFFEILDRSAFDKYVQEDKNSIGDFAYGEAVYQSDVAYLNRLAQQHGHALGQLFSMLGSMYSKEDKVVMPYSGLSKDTDYMFIVYGMEDSDKATRKTAMCLYEFSTGYSNESGLEFTGMATDVTETYATITVNPSNNSEYWYMNWASEIELQSKSLADVMQSSINSAKSLLTRYTADQILCHGPESLQATDLMPGTEYSVIAWGMNLDMAATTEPKVVFTFSTKGYDVIDDCTFTIDILEVEDMDVRVKVTPSKMDTRYYVAFVEESIMEGYSDEQAAQRIINMEAQRIEQHYYDVENLSWANLPGLEAGVRDIWGRRDEGWTFKPEHNYHIYVFGIDNFGIRSTVVARKDVTTAEGGVSNNHFTLTVDSATWQGIDFTVTPELEEYWTYFVIETADLESFRSGAGLDDKAIMHEIEEYYEHNNDNILYYTFNNQRSLHTHVTPETMYSILVFGYSGTNSTQMYEWQVYAPAPPFNTSEADYSYTYELFRGEDLSALNPTLFPLVDFQGDCVMVLKLTPNEYAAHWCLGIWPPKENFRESGGKYHLMTLDLDTTASGSAMQDKKFFRTRPWWYGCGSGSETNKEPWMDDEGHIMNYYPWTISGWAEDANGNYGPWHYEYLIPIPKPKAEVTGPYEVGYTEAYDFWSNPSGAPMQVYSVSTGNEIKLK